MLAARLRHELQLDVPITATPEAAREARRLHAAGLEAIANGQLAPGIAALERAAALWPSPAIEVAIWRAQTAAGQGKAARIAGDRALALAERIGGAPGRVELHRGHHENVHQVAYDPSGRYLVSRSAGELVVWDIDRGEPLHHLQDGEPADLVAMAFAGDTLIVATHDGRVQSWDILRGERLAQLTFERIDAMAVVPGGDKLALADTTTLRVVDRDGTVRWTAESAATQLAVSRDGKWLVAGGDDGAPPVSRLVVHAIGDGAVARTFAVPRDSASVEAVTIAPDASLVAVGVGKRVHVFARATGKRLTSIAVGDPARHVELLSGELLRVDDTLYDPRSGAKLRPASCRDAVRADGGETACVTPGAPGHYPRSVTLVAAGGTTRLLGHTDRAESTATLALDPANQRLAIGNGREPVVIDLATGAPRFLPRQPEITAVALGPQGQLAVAGGRAFTVYDHDGARLANRELAGNVRAVAFSPDGRQLAYADGQALQLLDTADWHPLRRWPLHPGEVRAIAWSQDGARLLATAAQAAILWDAASGKELARHDVYDGAALHPSGMRFAATDVSAGVVMVQADGRAAPFGARTSSAYGALAYAPDGMVAAADTDGAWLYDAAGGRRALAWPDTYLDAVVFDGAGRLVIAGDARREVAMFDARSGQRVLALVVGDGGHWAAYDARGRVDGDATLSGLDLAFGIVHVPAELEPSRRQPGLIATLFARP